MEPKETFWGLVTHFIYDVTHFDGKFFDTTKYLLLRPGFLAKEYLRGRRASYLNPVRMYVFTSALFFIIYFSFVAETPEEKFRRIEKELITDTRDLRLALGKETDSIKRKKIQEEIIENNGELLEMQQTGLLARQKGQVIGITAVPEDMHDNVININKLPRTLHEYDSIQRALPPEKRNGWLPRYFNRKIIQVNLKYRGRTRDFISDISDRFRHSIPQMMFVSLPLVALALQLLYARRKQFYYVNHLVFSLNVYIAVFLMLLVAYFFDWLIVLTGLAVFDVVPFLIRLVIYYYVYKSMRNFYGQGRGKTILKFFLLAFIILVLFALLIAIFGINSLLKI
ncbi:MAG: hypothetical protein K0Q66_971 [Chitinophagaceae bacterium]|jgi:hypothetical protein|nr:hypothetical protein [Chitinophagaceae bacterium]